jgi:hypothetical protein
MNRPTFDVNNSTVRNRYNRGFDTKHEPGVSKQVEIGLQTIDTAILRYLQNNIKPVVSQQGKQIPVPVIYGNPERWKSAQQDGALRDKNGMIMLPIMMIARTGLKENSINNPTNKYQTYTFKTGWNSRNIYDRFALVNGITPSQVYHSSVMPDFYDITYEGVVWTEFTEQMNKVIENLSFESNEYWGEINNYKFISKIGQFENTVQLPADSSRLVRSKFTVDVKAYILPQSTLDKNGNREQTTKLQYSPKKVVFDTEVITGPINK